MLALCLRSCRENLCYILRMCCLRSSRLVIDDSDALRDVRYRRNGIQSVDETTDLELLFASACIDFQRI